MIPLYKYSTIRLFYQNIDKIELFFIFKAIQNYSCFVLKITIVCILKTLKKY